MKKLVFQTSVLSIIVAGAFALFGLVSTNLSAQELPAQQSENQQNDQATPTPTPTPENYSYTAQYGDSYSVLARKAVQTYGIETRTEIGKAGVLFAETNLTLAANSPILEEGQAVSISKASVKEWVDRAASLTEEQKANWAYYVEFVNFDTSSVGEARKG